MVVHLLEMTWGHDHNSVSDGGIFAAGRWTRDLLWLTNAIMPRLRWGRGLLFLAALPQRCHSWPSPCGGVCLPKRSETVWVTLSSTLVGFLPFISRSVGPHLPGLSPCALRPFTCFWSNACHSTLPWCWAKSWRSKVQGYWTSVGRLLGNFTYSAKRGPGVMHILRCSSSTFCRGT